MGSKIITVDVLALDLCHTLFNEDTTLGLVTLYLNSTGKYLIRRMLLRMMVSQVSPIFFIARIFERVSRKQFLKYLIIRLLAGVTIRDLENAAERYIEYLMAHRKIAAVWEVFEGIDRNRTIIASASLEPVVKIVAQRLGAYYVSSELETLDGRYTGRYLKDITGEKHDALSVKFGDASLKGSLAVVSDNISDFKLIDMAKYRFVVIHQRRHLARWGDLRACFIKAAP